MFENPPEKNAVPNVKEIINSSTEMNPEAIQELDSIARLISNLKETQDALRESEEKYRLLFSNVPLGILHFDSKGKITTCNDNFLTIIDTEKENVVGAALADVIDIHLVSAIENALAGTFGHYEGDFTSRTSGKITQVRVNFAPVILDNGVISGGVGIFEDITERKQIERIFFHDILNTAGSLNNVVSLVNDENINRSDRKELLDVVESISKRIIDEINTHKHLLTADKSKLQLNIQKIQSLKFLESISNYFDRLDILENKKIQISLESENIEFESDETLLGRVLSNMIKNAIEASQDGEQITLWCGLDKNSVSFSVHNLTVIPEDIQTQLFNRTVSTKGSGRGLGIYSMKYLTEKYLDGKIFFMSTKEKGTTFVVNYPIQSSELKLFDSH